MADTSLPAGSTSFGCGARVDRFCIAPGLDGAVFEYRRTEGRRCSAVSDRVEIGVQLAGERGQAGHSAGTRLCGPGLLQTLGHAEPYDVTYRAGDQPGIVVYFLFDEAFAGSTDASRDLRFDDRCPRFTRTLTALAEALYTARASGAALRGAAVASALEEAVGANATEGRADPLVQARKEIEKHFDCDLYLRHLAESVGMNPTVFSRKFARRYGITPIQYRIRVRLNEADRMALQDLDLTTAQIAAACGFENLSYFHRSFAGYFGATLSQRRARVRQANG